MRTPVNRNSAAPAGFTLIELIVTVFIVGILASLAAPSFREYIATQRIKNASFDLVAALSFTRSEALKRNASVDICGSATDWASSGWTVRIGSVNCSGTTLRTQNAYPSVVITATDTTPAAVATLIYGNDGRPNSKVSFNISLPTPISGVTSRCVTIDLSGTARSNKGGC